MPSEFKVEAADVGLVAVGIASGVPKLSAADWLDQVGRAGSKGRRCFILGVCKFHGELAD